LFDEIWLDEDWQHAVLWLLWVTNISDINTILDSSLTKCAAGEDSRPIWDENHDSTLQNFCGASTVSFVEHTTCNALF